MKNFLVVLFIIFAGIFLTGAEAFAATKYGPSWEKSSLKVYIPNDSYSGMMQRAFLKWAEKCNGKLNFEFVTATPADIEVNFADKTDGTDGDIGSYVLTVKGGFITNVIITIAPNPSKNSNDLIYTVMLHEIGHALGLLDSNRKLGIMATPVNSQQDIINTDIYRLFQVNGWSYAEKNTPIPINVSE